MRVLEKRTWLEPKLDADSFYTHKLNNKWNQLNSSGLQHESFALYCCSICLMLWWWWQYTCHQVLSINRFCCSRWNTECDGSRWRWYLYRKVKRFVFFQSFWTIRHDIRYNIQKKQKRNAGCDFDDSSSLQTIYKEKPLNFNIIVGMRYTLGR